MQRLTARLLLLFLLTDVCAPFAEAFAAQPAHACCLRKLHRASGGHELISNAQPQRGNCCPPLTTPHTAQLQFPNTGVALPQSSNRQIAFVSIFLETEFGANHSSRAPPFFS
jgi:hypothetical protein